MPTTSHSDFDGSHHLYGKKSKDLPTPDSSDKSSDLSTSDSDSNDFVSCFSDKPSESIDLSSCDPSEKLPKPTPKNKPVEPKSKVAAEDPKKASFDYLSFKNNYVLNNSVLDNSLKSGCFKTISGLNACSDLNKSSRKKKTCFVCGSALHLIKDCDFYDKHVNSVWHDVNNIPSYIPKAQFSRNKVPSERLNSDGWKNKTFFGPTSTYFQKDLWNGCYDPMNVGWDRWGTAVKPSAGCSWRNTRPYFERGSKNNGGSHQSAWTSNLMIHKAGLSQ